jgi:tetratricopeptide (TPR) repeat protein
MAMSSVASQQSPLRVFVSYLPQSLGSAGSALISALKNYGARVSPKEPRIGDEWTESIAKEIENAELMIVLIAAGDELSRSVQYETRLMLQNCWARPSSHISVIAPAVGAIPRALRHQPFVSYYAYDDVHVDQWGSDSYLENFVTRLLQSSSTHGGQPPQQFTDKEIHEWRNRVVHIGDDTLLVDPIQTSQLQQRLQRDLAQMQDLLREAEASRTRMGREDIDRIYDRIVVSRAMGDNDMALQYYKILQSIYEMYPPTSPAEEAGFQYGFALAETEVRDFIAARELLSQAVATNERVMGRYNPATISAKYALGVTYANLGDKPSAASTLQDALTCADESLGENHPQTADIAYSLGLIRKDQGEIPEARRLFQLAYDTYKNVRPEDSPELQRVATQLDSIGNGEK